MIGEIDRRYFGPGGMIVLIEYPEATYLRDEREHTGILYTGSKDRQKAIKRRPGRWAGTIVNVLPQPGNA